MANPIFNKTLFRRLAVIAAVCVAILAGTAQAQYQVSQPGEPGRNAPGSLLNNPDSPFRGAGYELYGNNNREKSNYGQNTWYLPSEITFINQRNGATQSELRVQGDLIGQLAPSNASYVPPVSPLQRSLGVGPPVVFGSAYEKESNTTVRNVNNGMISHQNDAGVGQPGFGSQVQPGRVGGYTPNGSASENGALNGPLNRSLNRAANLQLSQQPIVQQPIQPITIPSGRPIGPMTVVNETVNRPIHRIRPATQPTTRPTTQPLVPTDLSKRLIIEPDAK